MALGTTLAAVWRNRAVPGHCLLCVRFNRADKKRLYTGMLLCNIARAVRYLEQVAKSLKRIPQNGIRKVLEIQVYKSISLKSGVQSLSRQTLNS